MNKRIDLIKKGGFAPGEHLQVANAEVPVAGENEVVIEVKASAINPVDWKMAELGIFIAETLPAALGCDVAGVVVAACDEQKSMIGKRVVTYLGADKTQHKTDRGAYVQYVAAYADVVVEIPNNMSFASAAALPVGALTAELLLNQQAEGGVLKEGDPILIWGASSSVGHYAVQVAIKRGLKPIAVASGRHKDALMALGAYGFVDYTTSLEDIQETIEKLCDPKRGARAFVDCAKALVPEPMKKPVEKIRDERSLNGAVDCIGTGETFLSCCRLVVANGDADKEKIVSTVTGWGLPEAPTGVVTKPVDLGSVLENETSRAVIRKALPEVVSLTPQNVRLVKGHFSAETVHKAFMLNKNGVSGEKVVIEWE